VLRRLRLCVERFPRFGAALEVETFCSGTGSLVAERRSTVRDGAGAAVQALALWVHLDADGTHPRPLPRGFEAVYGASAAARRVRARLRHPAAPPAGAPVRPWRFRAADLDLAGHVNNAVYWQVLEEELAGSEPAALDAEIEHRAAADAGDAEIAAADGMRWVSAGGAVVATIRVPD
jgi:acyl-ACP thioesterase